MIRYIPIGLSAAALLLSVVYILNAPRYESYNDTTLHTNGPAARAAVRQCLGSVNVDSGHIVSAVIAPVGNGAYSVKCKRRLRRE